MPLELLKIYNGRNLIEYTLKPHPLFNIIYGSNGAGKTTILESIYLLLRSRTFRSSKYKSFINHDAVDCTVFSLFSSHKTPDFESSFTLGINRSRNFSQPVIHLDSKKINSLSTITKLVILGLITPDSFTLLDAGPSIRRKFIDWGVFHVEPNFISDWRSYKKILTSRNNLLSQFSYNYKRTHAISNEQIEQIKCWSPQLIYINNKLNNYRNNQVSNISNYLKKYLSLFSEDLSNKISFKYYQGWNKDINYEDYLSNKISEDLIAGSTRYGTHRGELRINYNKNLAKDILSRGQKKIVIICLILSQFKYLLDLDPERKHNILLLDDIDSELDDNNLIILFNILSTFRCQIILTTTNKNKYKFIKDNDAKWFHVEQE